MKKLNDTDILKAIQIAERKKKRVTFFISESAKGGLASWCKKNQVTESGAVEQMIRATIPETYFPEAE